MALKPDFTKYSLALVESDKIVFSSRESGLKPLWECLKIFNSSERNFILFDKVIGLAAAKLIVHTRIISRIETPLVSEPAKIFLQKNDIPIKAGQIVPNILTKDRKAICPGEIIALNTFGTDDFLKKIEEMLNSQ
jgi:hypothetical protein